MFLRAVGLVGSRGPRSSVTRQDDLVWCFVSLFVGVILFESQTQAPLHKRTTLNNRAIFYNIPAPIIPGDWDLGFAIRIALPWCRRWRRPSAPSRSSACPLPACVQLKSGQGRGQGGCSPVNTHCIDTRWICD